MNRHRQMNRQKSDRWCVNKQVNRQEDKWIDRERKVDCFRDGHRQMNRQKR